MAHSSLLFSRSLTFGGSDGGSGGGELSTGAVSYSSWISSVGGVAMGGANMSIYRNV